MIDIIPIPTKQAKENGEVEGTCCESEATVGVIGSAGSGVVVAGRGGPA